MRCTLLLNCMLIKPLRPWENTVTRQSCLSGDFWRPDSIHLEAVSCDKGAWESGDGLCRTAEALTWPPVLRVSSVPGHCCARAGWGLLVCMLSMLAGGMVEMVRLSLFKQGHVLTDDKNAVVDMSVFWQIPQYILVGLSEVGHCSACS